ARDLAHYGDGPAGARVDLDDVYLPVAVDDELYIEQTYYFQRFCEPYRIVGYHVLYFPGKSVGRVYGDAVARVYACSFHMLEYAGDQHVFAVTDPVHFRFDAVDVLVYEHRVLRRYLHRHFHVLFKRPVVVHYFHGPSAE